MAKNKRRYTKAQRQALKQALGHGEYVPVWKSDSTTSPNTVGFDPGIPYHAKYSTTSSADFRPIIPSAVVQQNNQEENYEADLDAVRSFVFPETAAKAAEIEKRHIEIKVKEMAKEADARRKYITDVQAFLYNSMPQITQHFAKLDKKEKTAANRPNIHRLANPNLQKGTYVNLLTNRGPIKDGQAMYSEFVHATPDQLAHLVPLLRFFIVDQDGNEDEIYFSDHASGDYAKTIADLRSSGDINQFLSPTRTQKGSDVGIKSFTWNYHNKHEGDFVIEADLELYFGTLAELANINYLRFLFPTGTSTALATELASGSETMSNAERGRNQKRRHVTQRITDLDQRIKSIKKILGSSAEDINKVPLIQDKKLRSSRSKEFRQLKVIVGWAVPGGNSEQLKKSFKNPLAYDSFIESLRATNKAIFLNLSDYNVEFQQEGPTTLSLSYLGSTDNYLASAASDVFGSNNLDDVDNKLLYTVTHVPITGFASSGGRIFDLRNTTSAELDNLEGGVTGVDSVASQGPYIQSIISRQKKGAMQHLMKNADGEYTIGVTLAGLRAAQELQSLQLQMAQLQKKADNSPTVQAIRLRGQLLTLLYDRAELVRLRDIYSRYLEGLLGSDLIRKARIETPDAPNQPPKLILQDDALSPKEREAIMRGRKRPGSGDKNWYGAEIPMPEGDDPPLTSPFESTQVYYMRLGDILYRAMETSGLRDDISIIMGNTGRLNVPHSLYDIPITIDQFGQFFYNRIVSRKLRSYPFRYFMNDMLKLVARVINQDPRIFDRIAFDYTVVSGQAMSVANLPFALEKDDLIKIGKSQEDPLSNATLKFQTFYPIFENNTSHEGRTGDRRIDEAEGIYHYVIGSNRGLAKTFNFSRQETEYFQEMLIESNNLDDKIHALFLPQNVSLTLYGNTLHKNGDLIFIDSRPSLGSFAGPVLGIGGYYRVIRSTHEISNRGYETSLECVFELRVQPDKTRPDLLGG